MTIALIFFVYIHLIVPELCEGCPALLLTLLHVVRLLLFLYCEHVSQMLIRFFGVLPTRLEPWDGTVRAPWIFAQRCIAVR
jgi:hypothetical protein